MAIYRKVKDETMKICYNSPAMLANNALTRNDNRLTQSLQRLSSGLKIVEAKDNPAGLAMGKKMNAQLKGISVATQNSSESISVIEIADGALSEVHEILQRMNELAIHASNGAMSDDDRKTIEAEIVQLKAEITRISNTTQFNGQTLLNGNFDLKGYTDEEGLKVGYYSDQVTPGKYEIGNLNIVYDANGEIDVAGSNFAGGSGGDLKFPTDAKITSAYGNTVTVTSLSNPNFEMNFKVTPPVTFPMTNVEVDITGMGAMTMQIGANEGQTLDIRIPAITLENLKIKDLSFDSQEAARDGIEDIAGAISYVSATRSRLGAYQNRLEHTINNLDVVNENMTAAYSRIMDVDMATEMTEYTTVQVIAQASMSMLAQANERPAQVLQLLQ